MNSLRILHICPRPSFSGLEAYALSMAQGQKALGHQITMGVLPSSPLEDKCASAGIETFQIPANFSGRLKAISSLSRLLASSDRPDIVHLHSTQDLDMMLLPLFTARTRGANPSRSQGRSRIILQTHIWISHTKKDPLHAISYSLVDEVWCSSEPAKETLTRFLPISARKIRIVNYGRDIAGMESAFLSREEARQALGLPRDATVIANVARIDEGKGTRELLEASLRAMEHEPTLHLMLIGPPTADDPKAVEFGKMVLDRIAHLPENLRSRVHAPGAVPESFKYLKAFDLFCLPTYKECFALSLLEAQLAGLPCLATNSGGSPEVVREGQTGWLFEPRSIDACYDALTRALSERERWAAYGLRARERVRRDFDFNKILPTTVDAYRELLT